eukprot:3633137-Alexandrium_andersonii.AAC.1
MDATRQAPTKTGPRSSNEAAALRCRGLPDWLALQLGTPAVAIRPGGVQDSSRSKVRRWPVKTGTLPAIKR